MRNIFNHIDETQPVELEIVTPELGKFAITGSYDEVLPSYQYAVRQEKTRRHSGRFALSGF